MTRERLSRKRSPLKVRNPRIDDVRRIREIANQYTYELHNNPQVQKIVQQGSKVVGYGTLKLFAEVVMVLDSNLSTRDKAESLALMMEEGQLEANKLGSEYIYMCTPDENYARLVAKHFGFQLMKGHHFLRRKVR